MPETMQGTVSKQVGKPAKKKAKTGTERTQEWRNKQKEKDPIGFRAKKAAETKRRRAREKAAAALALEAAAALKLLGTGAVDGQDDEVTGSGPWPEDAETDKEATTLTDAETDKEATTLTIAVRKRVDVEYLQGVEKAGNAFFDDATCKFSDPSGVGAWLPKVVAEIFSNEVEHTESQRKPTAKKGSQELEIVYDQLRAFLPQHANKTPPCIMLYLLSQLSAFLGKNGEEILSGLYGEIKNNTSDKLGIRLINGGRVEIFMNDIKRPPACIHAVLKRMLIDDFARPTSPLPICDIAVERSIPAPEICNDTIEKVIKCLVAYCNHLAYLDGRIAIADPPYVFQNHAIIASYGEVPAQDIHIDLDLPGQYQFGVLLSANSPPTLEYRARKDVLGETTSLKTIWPDISIELDKKLRANKDTQHDLNCYGCLLSEPGLVKRKKGAGRIPKKDQFPIGSLISLPGRVAHGGPSSKTFRAVIFFTGAPRGAAVYDSDKQANRTMLVGNMLVLSWLDMDQEERVYLLKKWYEHCLKKDKFGVANIFHVHLKHLGEVLKKFKSTENDRAWQLIESFAHHGWDEQSWLDPSEGEFDWSAY